MITIGPLARRAAAQGVPAAQRFTMADGTLIDFEVTAEGLVTVRTPGWEAVTDGLGAIAEFRPVPFDPVTQMAEGVVSLHVMFTNLRCGGFTIDEAAAVVAAMIRGSAANPQQEET